MGRPIRPRAPGLRHFLSMASTATALTLSNFQNIASPGVSIGCIVAYNTQIPGCTTSDFTRGQSCSSSCINGLAAVQAAVGAVCDDSSVSSSSVLGQALLGNLVGLLCPSGAGGGAANPAVTTQTAVVITSSRPQTTSDKPDPAPPTTTTTTSRARETTTTETRETDTTTLLNSPTETTNAVPTTTISPDPASTQPSDPESSLVPASTEQTGGFSFSPTTQVSTAAAQRPTGDTSTAPGNSGANSFDPFNTVVDSSSPSRSVGSSQASLLAVVLTALLLLR